MNEFVCDVPGCGKRFQKKSRLFYHKNQHENKKPFKCDYDGCGAAYSWAQHLKRHVEKIHSHPEKEFKCAISNCVATFDTEQALSQHKRRAHSALKQVFSCLSCDLKFDYDWQLREHEASHTNQKPFVCEHCEEKHDTFSEFKKHERSHKSKRRVYECKVCLKQFPNFKSYREHCNEHSADERTCKECNVVFQRKRHLMDHISVSHSENKPAFTCSVDGCSRSYTYKKNLDHHMRFVHKALVFPCNQCSRELCTKQKLQLHKQQVHGVPKPKKKPVNKSNVKKKLITQLSGNGDGKMDVDVTIRRKPVLKNKHFSYLLQARQAYSDEPLDLSNPTYQKYSKCDTRELPLSEI